MSESAVIENNDNDNDFLTQEEINQDVLDKYNFLVACSSTRVGKPNLFDRLGVIYRSIFK